MQTVVTKVIPGASPAQLFAHLESLERYPAWMRLVHRVTSLEPDDGREAWWVELRARVGPFTRSKQLRMVRTEFEPGRRARFERIQADDRDHAQWILEASVSDDILPSAEGPGAAMTMDLEYTGQLWSRAVLGRILDDEIRRSAKALTGLLATSGSESDGATSGSMSDDATSGSESDGATSGSTSDDVTSGSMSDDPTSEATRR